MKYLENSFKFFGKFFSIFIPFLLMPIVIIALTITRIIAAMGEIKGLSTFFTSGVATNDIINGGNQFILSLIMPILGTLLFVFIISFVVSLIVYPATFGMISKAYSTGNASLADFFPEFKKNILKYIQYGLTMLLFGIGFYLAFLLVSAVVGIIFGLLGDFGTVLNYLFSLVLNIFMMPISVLTLMWFATMVTEDCGPIVAFPKAAKACFSRYWSILGISLLLYVGLVIIMAIIGGVLIAMHSYVLLGILLFVIAMIYSIIIMIYSFEVYRGETYKDDILNGGGTEVVPETPGDYL